MKCPHCGGEIPQSAISSELGKRTSDRKKQSSAENGKKGGRPPRPKDATAPPQD